MSVIVARMGAGMDARWRSVALFAVVAVGIGLLYSDAVVGAWRVWLGSTAYNHCLLILPLAGFMAWNRRQRLVGVWLRLEWPMLALLVPVVLVWLCGRLFSVLEVQQFAIVTMLQVAALVLFGWPIYRRLIAPFLFLYLLVPTGMFLVVPLQNFMAKFVVLCLQLSGIPVLGDGTIIQVSSGTFVVAEACAGLRFLIAAVAFGIFFACEVYSSIKRRLGFIALCFIIPIFANGLRGFGLILASEMMGSATAVEADHVLYGWLFFSIVLFILISVGQVFADRTPFAPHGPIAEAVPGPASRGGPLVAALAAAACLLLAAGGPLAQAALSTRASVVLPSVPPPVPAGWHKVAPSTDWRPIVRAGDRTFSDSIEKDGIRIDRFVAFYAPHGAPANPAGGEDRLADPEIWRPISAGSHMITIQGRAVPVQTLEAVAPGTKRLVWGLYLAGGQAAGSGWKARWYAVRAYVAASTCPAAFFALSTSDPEARSQPLVGYLADANLESYVCP